LGDDSQKRMYFFAFWLFFLKVLLIKFVESLKCLLVCIYAFILIDLLPGCMDTRNAPAVHHVYIRLYH
jgi:hypothetical protein